MLTLVATVAVTPARANGVDGSPSATNGSVTENARVLTPQVLASYIATQQAKKGFNIFGATPSRLGGLTSGAVLAYAAQETDPANAALLAIDNAAASTPHFSITDSQLADYASRHFVPTVKKVAQANKERLCLSQAIYYEARGESDNGQWAVANVIINRAMSSRFPATLCGVVFQNANEGLHRCQFSFACDGRPEIATERGAWQKATHIARAAYAEFQRGKRPNVVPRSTLFYHTRAVNPAWSNDYKEVAEIGAHLFYSPL